LNAPEQQFWAYILENPSGGFYIGQTDDLARLVGGIAVYVYEASEVPYRLQLFEVGIRGKNRKGEQQTLHGERAPCGKEMSGPTIGAGPICRLIPRARMPVRMETAHANELVTRLRA
jgi:hypothetical protein